MNESQPTVFSSLPILWCFSHLFDISQTDDNTNRVSQLLTMFPESVRCSLGFIVWVRNFYKLSGSVRPSSRNWTSKFRKSSLNLEFWHRWLWAIGKQSLVSWWWLLPFLPFFFSVLPSSDYNVQDIQIEMIVLIYSEFISELIACRRTKNVSKISYAVQVCRLSLWIW